MDAESEIEFVKLLTDHQPVIRAFVISLLPGEPGADDVIQETNVVLWTKRGEFTIGTNFRAWALTIARFQVMAHCQVLKRRRAVPLDEDVMELLISDMEKVLDTGFVTKRIRALESCILLLRPEDRELLLQRYWRKTRLEDFAELHNRSLNGLKVQLFRLRSALKYCIEQRLEGKCGP